MILSKQDSIQLQKFKSNEFDDFDDYKDKNLNNEYNSINFKNENNIEYDYKKENRRLIVEYLKIIKNRNNSCSLDEICAITNINKDILNLVHENSILEDLEQNIFLLKKNNRKKVNFLNFLSTPRIMFLISKETKMKIPHIFSLSPNVQTFENGFESYSFKWSNINDLSDKTSYDLSYLKKCKLKEKDYTKFYMI